MNFQDRERARREARERKAKVLLIETMAVLVCPVHHEALINQGDRHAVAEAKKLGRALIESGEIDCSFEEIERAIDDKVTASADECYLCSAGLDG